jgi:hypothetical protein
LAASDAAKGGPLKDRFHVETAVRRWERRTMLPMVSSAMAARHSSRVVPAFPRGNGLAKKTFTLTPRVSTWKRD